MQRVIALFALAALVGCEKDCDCGLVRDDGVNCVGTGATCEYGLYIEWNCGGEGWKQVDQYTYLNYPVGREVCF